VQTPTVSPLPPAAPKPGISPANNTDPLNPVPNAAVSKLRREVEQVCGKQAQEVQVVLKADKLMHVKVKVSDPQVGVALTDKILQLPEMKTPHVRLEIEVVDKR
jgi:hypothetical protein